MADGLLVSFLGALQASISVLLTISFGVVAAQFDLLKGSSTKQISKLCVRMFLPALLITNVGSQLHLDTALRYVPILSMLGSFRSTRIEMANLMPSMEFHLHSFLYVVGLCHNSPVQTSFMDDPGAVF